MIEQYVLRSGKILLLRNNVGAQFRTEIIKIVANGKEYAIKNHECSVVDPVGRVFEFEGEFYRAIRSKYIEDYKQLLSSPKIGDFFDAGLVETAISDIETKNFGMLVKHKKVDFKSLWYEWAPNMLRDGAKMVAKLGKILYQNGYCYKDGNLGNVLFDYTRPVFIDLGSILPLEKIPNSRNLNPALFPWEFSGAYIKNWFGMMEKYSNLTKKEAFKIREEHKNDALSFFDAICEYLDHAEFEYNTTEWRGYGARQFDFDRGLNTKQQSFYELLSNLNDAETVLDIGGNKGAFSRVAHDLGYKVVNFDIDIYSIMQLYEHEKKAGRRILPLVMNFMKPSERYRGHADAYDRLKCDVTLFLALIHHLSLRQGITFEEIADRLSKFTKKYCMVEFILLSDIHVGNWPQPPWYRKSNFVEAMSNVGFEMIRQMKSAPSPREILFFRKRKG